MTEVAVTVREGEHLLSALYRLGALLPAACGGDGQCRRCGLLVLAGPEGAGERRLACEVRAPGEYRIDAPRLADRPDPVPPPAAPSGRPAALAVDAGTTTLAAALVDGETGRVLARAARPNPQAPFGPDVLARVRWARDAGHRATLSDLVRRGVAALAAGLFRETGRTAGDVAAAALAGNPTMTLLLLGRDPARLAVPPYEPGLAEEWDVAVEPAALGLPSGARVRFLPALGGHVGSDTTAGLLAAALPDGDTPALLVDLGTNGEVALAAKGALLAASSAAGPAFEGGGLEHGSPAGPGAVARVEAAGGGLELTTVDGGPPRSWCGSGAIEITAALLASGRLGADGRLLDLPALPVPFTQADVREVQLAKGAVGAAIRILCREAGIALADLRRVVLTGAFGAALRPDPARAIGLVPAEAPVEALPGGALAGAVLALSPGGQERAAAAAARTRHVPLGDRRDFEETFVSSLGLAELR